MNSHEVGALIAWTSAGLNILLLIPMLVFNVKIHRLHRQMRLAAQRHDACIAASLARLRHTEMLMLRAVARSTGSDDDDRPLH